VKKEHNRFVSALYDRPAALPILWWCGENNMATNRSSRYLRAPTLFRSFWCSSTIGPCYWSIIFHERNQEGKKRNARPSSKSVSTLKANDCRPTYLLHCTIVFTDNLLCSSLSSTARSGKSSREKVTEKLKK